MRSLTTEEVNLIRRLLNVRFQRGTNDAAFVRNIAARGSITTMEIPKLADLGSKYEKQLTRIHATL